MYTISFCTAIRNRLHHLKQTLPQNLKDNSAYSFLEFVVLDYDSNDGLKEWITTTLAEPIANGRLVYIHSPDHEYFHRSHSRNLAFGAAKGQLVCNVDADNYTGKNFAEYINQQFSLDDDLFLTAFSAEQPNSPDLFGRICCKKTHFFKVNGYNEKMDGYGFEDHELIDKLSKLGLRRQVMTDPEFFNAITHGDDERIKEEKAFRSLKDMYLSFVSPSRTDILYLFKDGNYAKGRLVDRTTDNYNSPENVLFPKKHRYEFTLTTTDWQRGIWIENYAIVHLTSTDEKTTVYNAVDDLLINESARFQLVQDKKLLTDLLLFYTQFSNRNFLNDDVSHVVLQPSSAEQDSHRILTSSLYWPADEWHQILIDIVQPIFRNLTEQDVNAFGVLRFNNYRGANICITWFLPYHRAEAFLHSLHQQISEALTLRPEPQHKATSRSHSTFTDISPGQLAYDIYQYPTVQAITLHPPAIIFLSRQLTDVILAILPSDRIDQDTTFTLAFYLHVLAVKCLGMPDKNQIRLTESNGTQDQLSNVLTDNTELLQEILKDLASWDYINAPENEWMKNWLNACSAVAGDGERRVILDDISNLIIDTLGLPQHAKSLIFNFITQGAANNK